MGDEVKRIVLARTGGFANVPVHASVFADALTPDERAGLDALLSRAPAEGTLTGDPDRFQYDVTVVSGERHHHVRLHERDIDDQLRPLIDSLEREATP